MPSLLGVKSKNENRKNDENTMKNLFIFLKKYIDKMPH